MNKGVKRSNTGYKGLADISNNQGFEPDPSLSIDLGFTYTSGLWGTPTPKGVMYSHGPHMDVTDLELSPIIEMWSDIY